MNETAPFGDLPAEKKGAKINGTGAQKGREKREYFLEVLREERLQQQLQRCLDAHVAAWTASSSSASNLRTASALVDSFAVNLPSSKPSHFHEENFGAGAHFMPLSQMALFLWMLPPECILERRIAFVTLAARLIPSHAETLTSMAPKSKSHGGFQNEKEDAERKVWFAGKSREMGDRTAAPARLDLYAKGVWAALAMESLESPLVPLLQTLLGAQSAASSAIKALLELRRSRREAEVLLDFLCKHATQHKLNTYLRIRAHFSGAVKKIRRRSDSAPGSAAQCAAAKKAQQSSAAYSPQSIGDEGRRTTAGSSEDNFKPTSSAISPPLARNHMMKDKMHADFKAARQRATRLSTDFLLSALVTGVCLVEAARTGALLGEEAVRVAECTIFRHSNHRTEGGMRHAIVDAITQNIIIEGDDEDEVESPVARVAGDAISQVRVAAAGARDAASAAAIALGDLHELLATKFHETLTPNPRFRKDLIEGTVAAWESGKMEIFGMDEDPGTKTEADATSWDVSDAGSDYYTARLVKSLVAGTTRSESERLLKDIISAGGEEGRYKSSCIEVKTGQETFQSRNRKSGGFNRSMSTVAKQVELDRRMRLGTQAAQELLTRLYDTHSTILVPLPLSPEAIATIHDPEAMVSLIGQKKSTFKAGTCVELRLGYDGQQIGQLTPNTKGSNGAERPFSLLSPSAEDNTGSTEHESLPYHLLVFTIPVGAAAGGVLRVTVPGALQRDWRAGFGRPLHDPPKHLVAVEAYVEMVTPIGAPTLPQAHRLHREVKTLTL
jgi:hypothetical protein